MAMAGTGNTADFEIVGEELMLMRQRLEELRVRVEALEGGRVAAPAELPARARGGTLAGLDSREGLGDWLHRSAVLQRVATVCFILVFALLLRTVTDYGYVNVKIGTVLGLGYVIFLIGLGIRFYAGRRPLAPVFAGCGFLLLFSIVLEAVSRFGTLGPYPALLILLVALAVGTYTGMRFEARRLLNISVLGVVISGLATNFPRVPFPAVGGLLLAASVVAALAEGRRVSRGLKWWVTLLAVVFWALWAFKLAMNVRHGDSLTPLQSGWFLPELFTFGLLYLGYYVFRFFRVAETNAFDAVLPSLNMLLFFLAGRVMLVDVLGDGTGLGLAAVLLAAVHFLVGWRLSSQDSGRCGAIGGSVVGGAIILALGLPQLLGQVAWAMPGWALVAYGLGRLSGQCGSGVMRAISYLYQIFGFWIGLVTGVLTTVQPGHLTASLTAAGAVAVFSLAQFNWCRKHPPAEGTVFAQLDGRDYSALLLLLTGLSGLYFVGVLLLDAFSPLLLADPLNTMRCGRSLLVNIGALVLLVTGARQRRLELIWVAAALGFLGLIKVFFVDLFRSNGLPLVLSVFSFGIVAAVGSLIMGRWQKRNSGPA